MAKKDKKNRRLEFLDMFPESVHRILDVGCSHGGLMQHMVKRGVEVVGIDRDSSVIERAKSRLSEVHCADIEEFEPPFEEKSFDCIVFADVLDCLVDPEGLILKYKGYLKEDGYLIVSMANVRYYKVITNLLFKGTWDYLMPGGILWYYHLRFFTLQTSKELFAKTGFDVEHFERFTVAGGRVKFFNQICFNAFKDLLAYQYYFRLKKNPKWIPGRFELEREVAEF